MYNSLEHQVKKEMDIQYSCDHPNVISLYHAWADDKKYYLVLEYGQENLLQLL